MWNGFIGRQIRRCNRNHLLTNLGLLLVPISIGTFGHRYWYNFSFGPFSIDAASLVKIENPDRLSQYFATVQGDRSIPTGFTEITRRYRRGVQTGEYTSGGYVALKVGQKLLVVKARVGNGNQTQFTGTLVNFSDKVRQEIIDRIETEVPQLRGILLPFVLEETNFRALGYLGLAVSIPALGIALWNLTHAIARQTNPQLHPIVRRLEQFDDSPEAAIAQIDAEIESNTRVFSVGSVLITSTWILKKTFYGLSLLPLSQLVWMYAKASNYSTKQSAISNQQSAKILLFIAGRFLRCPNLKT